MLLFLCVCVSGCFYFHQEVELLAVLFVVKIIEFNFPNPWWNNSTRWISYPTWQNYWASVLGYCRKLHSLVDHFRVINSLVFCKIYFNKNLHNYIGLQHNIYNTLFKIDLYNLVSKVTKVQQKPIITLYKTTTSIQFWL